MLSQRPYGAIAGKRPGLCGSTLLLVRFSAPCDRDSLRPAPLRRGIVRWRPSTLSQVVQRFLQRVLSALRPPVNRRASLAGCTVAALVFTRAGRPKTPETQGAACGQIAEHAHVKAGPSTAATGARRPLHVQVTTANRASLFPTPQRPAHPLVSSQSRRRAQPPPESFRHFHPHSPPPVALL